MLRGLPICMADTHRRFDRLIDGTPIVMPAEAGLYDFGCSAGGSVHWRPAPGRRLNGDRCPDRQVDSRNGIAAGPRSADPVVRRARKSLNFCCTVTEDGSGLRLVGGPTAHGGECRIKAAMRLVARIAELGWSRSVCKVVGHARCAAFRMEDAALAARPASPYSTGFIGRGGKRRGQGSFKEPMRSSGGKRMQRQVLCTGGVS